MLQGRVVDLEQCESLMIKHPHGRGVSIENQPVLRFAFPQFFLRLFAVGHVPRVDDERRDFRLANPVLPHRFQIDP